MIPIEEDLPDKTFATRLVNEARRAGRNAVGQLNANRISSGKTKHWFGERERIQPVIPETAPKTHTACLQLQHKCCIDDAIIIHIAHYRWLHTCKMGKEHSRKKTSVRSESMR